MSRINVPSEVTALAHALAILGNDAERTCAGFSTRQALERLYADLGHGKGGIMKLRRSIRDLLATDAAREREEARAAAVYARDEALLLRRRAEQASGERMAAGLGVAA
jgi:hypothetical protein